MVTEAMANFSQMSRKPLQQIMEVCVQFSLSPFSLPNIYSSVIGILIHITASGSFSLGLASLLSTHPQCAWERP